MILLMCETDGSRATDADMGCMIWVGGRYMPNYEFTTGLNVFQEMDMTTASIPLADLATISL